MRYLRMLGPAVLAVAVVAMMVGAGGAWGASSLVLTSPAGTIYNSEIHAVSEGGGIEMDTSSLYADFTCEDSTISAGPVEAGGSLKIPITDLTFGECWNATITVLKRGQLELQATGDGSAAVKWTGAEMTVTTHLKFTGGFSVTTHCIYKTEATHLGTFTDSSSTNGTAVLDVNSELPRNVTDTRCGEFAAVLTGTYTFVGPDFLDVESLPGTTLTSPKGTSVKAEATIKAESSTLHLTGSVKVSCKNSTLEAEVANSGGPGATVSGPVNALAFSDCGNDTVAVLNGGQLELHATTDGNGTLTSTGAEITVLTHKTIFGFPITSHCIYKTEATDIGTLTSSNATKGTAVLDVYSDIPKIKTDGSCGEDTAILTGTYTFTSPDYLDVD